MGPIQGLHIALKHAPGRADIRPVDDVVRLAHRVTTSSGSCRQPNDRVRRHSGTLAQGSASRFAARYRVRRHRLAGITRRVAFAGMATPRADRLGWLNGYSAPELRAALRSSAPQLADLPIALHGIPDLSKPMWASGRATLGNDTYAKFAFSELTATRIWREAQVLELLGASALPVPELVAASPNPAFSSTKLINGGVPLTYATVAASETGLIEAFAAQLASFLVLLHSAQTREDVLRRVDCLRRLPEPVLHVSTDDLRARFMAMIEPQQRSLVAAWCDWVDEELARSADTVFVHGDFHPYNQLWDLEEPRLLAILDFETSGLAEPEFDFRVLPVFGPGVDLLVSTVDHYEALSDRKLSVPRIMALHLLNHLGDSLWRSEAGIPAPGGTPSTHVIDAASRLASLGIRP